MKPSPISKSPNFQITKFVFHHQITKSSNYQIAHRIFVQINKIGANYFRKGPGKDLWQKDSCQPRFFPCRTGRDRWIAWT